MASTIINNGNGQPEYQEYLVGLLVRASTCPQDQHQVTQALTEFTSGLVDAPRYFAMVLIDRDRRVPGMIGKCIGNGNTGGNGSINQSQQSQQHLPNPEILAIQVRAMAGLLLKNQLRAGVDRKILRDTVGFLRESTILPTLQDPSPLVHSTVGTVLSTVVAGICSKDARSGGGGGGLANLWPELLPGLLQMAPRNLAAMDALEKICQDAASDLPNGQAELLVPALIELAGGHGDPRGRCHALVALNQFIMYGCAAFDPLLAAHLQTLSHLATHDGGHEPVRQAICQSLTLLLDAYPDEMSQILPGVLGYCLETLGREDGLSEGCRLEACEFWHSLAERDQAAEVITPVVLQQLLPVLLRAIRYSDDDPALLENEEDAALPDAPSSIRPRHHRAAMQGEDNQDEGGFDDDDDEDDKDDDDEDEWNLRKCAASTLDLLASTALPKRSDNGANVVIEALFPLINQQLSSHQDWKTVEASILALGAVSEGIGLAEEIQPHLPSIVPFLIESYGHHPKALVRSIAAWTLGRYARWMRADQAGMSVLAALLQGMRDGSKRVQRASCSALAVFVEKLPEQRELIVGLAAPALIEVIGWALQHYQLKNRLALYDTIGTLADELGSAIQGLGGKGDRPGLVAAILPGLLEDWEAHEAHGRSSLEYCYAVFPLLECLASLAIAGGPEFGPWAGQVYAKAMGMIERLMSANADHDDTIETDSLIVALDLIGGLVQGVGLALRPFVTTTTSSSSLGSVILKCAYDPIPEIRQSAFALIGDCAQRNLDDPLMPVLGQLIPAMRANFDASRSDAGEEGEGEEGETIYYSTAASNNAVWAFGELLYRRGSLMATALGFTNNRSNDWTHFYGILADLVHLGTTAGRSPGSGYAGNLAVAIGRAIGFTSSMSSKVLPGELQEGILRMLPNWTCHIDGVADQEERISALVPLLQHLPGQGVSRMPDLTILQLIQAIHGTSLSDADQIMAGWLQGELCPGLGAERWERLLATLFTASPSEQRSKFTTRFLNNH